MPVGAELIDNQIQMGLAFFSTEVSLGMKEEFVAFTTNELDHVV